MKPTLISGIQPSGRLHLGNYLGALKNFVDLQNSNQYHCHFFIADLHSLTEGFQPRQKKRQVANLLADFLAAGLNPKKSVLFLQSAIPAHSEMAWILNTITYFGELKRMTQFKDKTRRQKQNINAGLLTYPLLMTADIILYNAAFVPVGEDQLQHLELTRKLARRFNKKFGKTFKEPRPLLTAAPRIMDLTNPRQKMSKSAPNGCLFIDDSPKTITKKIKAAVTDAEKQIKYNFRRKPGVSNLLLIYSALSQKPIKFLEKEFAQKGYADFKQSLARFIANYFADYRRRKRELLKKPRQLSAFITVGNRQAAAIASLKIIEVKKRLGLKLI